jgi:hypothetical protein
VARHRITRRHRDWMGERFHECAGVGSPCAVSIPVDRDLCHWCSRTLTLIARTSA